MMSEGVSIECLQFAVSFCETSEWAIELVMDNMNMTETLVDIISNTTDSEIFKSSIRLVGTVLTHPTSSEYCDEFIKCNLLEALTVGWDKFGSD
jgi:hypothetical protein